MSTFSDWINLKLNTVLPDDGVLVPIADKEGREMYALVWKPRLEEGLIEGYSSLPRGERHTSTIAISVEGAFQSTLPRRERPQAVGDLTLIPAISIHAPTRGATADGTPDDRGIKISIHAHTRGATQ